MKLLVGLGNPGPRFVNNRHNIGFMILDQIVRHYGFGSWKRRFQSHLSQGIVDNIKVFGLLPHTYMNRSGQAVQSAVRFFKLDPTQVIVFHDDIALLPTQCKIKQGGGSAGHNGLRSIDSYLGQNYWRVRIGIGHPGHKIKVPDYVLHDFAQSDNVWLNSLIQTCVTALPLLLTDQIDQFTNAFNDLNRTARQTQTKTGTQKVSAQRASMTGIQDAREQTKEETVILTKGCSKNKVRSFFTPFRQVIQLFSSKNDRKS